MFFSWHTNSDFVNYKKNLLLKSKMFKNSCFKFVFIWRFLIVHYCGPAQIENTSKGGETIIRNHMLIISSCRQNKNGLCLHGIFIYNYFYCSLFSLLVFCGVYINSLSLIFSIIIGLIFYGVTYFISSKEKDMVLYIIRRNLDMEET